MRILVLAAAVTFALVSAAFGQPSSWTYDIFVKECEKSGGKVGSSREQYMRGERFACHRSSSGALQPGSDSACEREAKINTDWVLSGDRGARGTYERNLKDGFTAFESVLAAQAHNRKAQDSIRRCQAFVERYLAQMNELPAVDRKLGSADCKCISVIKTGRLNFTGREIYSVSNNCPRVNLAIRFTDQIARFGERANWGQHFPIEQGQTREINAPETFEIPSLEAYNLRSGKNSYTCVCGSGLCR